VNDRKSRDAAIRRASEQARKGIVIRREDTERPDEGREAWEESVARRIDAKQARGEQ
jgi:hypothetical protein